MASLWLAIGKQAIKSENWPLLLDVAERILSEDGSDADGYAFRAYANTATGSTQDAFFDAERALQIDPENALAYACRGVFKHNAGNLRGALVDFDLSLTYDPNEVSVWHTRSVVKKKLKDLKGALSDLCQAIALDPEDASIFYDRGLVRLELGDFKGAVLDADAAYILDPRAYHFLESGRNSSGVKIQTEISEESLLIINKNVLDTGRRSKSLWGGNDERQIMRAIRRGNGDAFGL
jgi:tetratricopeptide (TPR) repeat protein